MRGYFLRGTSGAFRGCFVRNVAPRLQPALNAATTLMTIIRIRVCSWFMVFYFFNRYTTAAQQPATTATDRKRTAPHTGD